MTQTNEKWDTLILSRTVFRIRGRCHGIPCFYMRMISVTVIVVTSKVMKVTWFSYVQNASSANARHIDKGIWWKLYIWRFYGHGSTCMLILSWVNIMKWKWTKVPLKLSIAQKFETVLWRTLHRTLDRFQTNLVFKFNLVLTE